VEFAEKGFTNIKFLAVGVEGWKKAGYSLQGLGNKNHAS
jgi:rhodanese-related sulfurtransferase